MIVFKLSLLLAISFFELISSNEWNCDLYFHFAKVCHRFEYNDIFCFEWDISKCEVVKTTYNDYRCPRHFCVEATNLATLDLDSSKLDDERKVSLSSDFTVTTEPTKTVTVELQKMIAPTKPTQLMNLQQKEIGFHSGSSTVTTTVRNQKWRSTTQLTPSSTVTTTTKPSKPTSWTISTRKPANKKKPSTTTTTKRPITTTHRRPTSTTMTRKSSTTSLTTTTPTTTTRKLITTTTQNRQTSTTRRAQITTTERIPTSTTRTPTTLMRKPVTTTALTTTTEQIPTSTTQTPTTLMRKPITITTERRQSSTSTTRKALTTTTEKIPTSTTLSIRGITLLGRAKPETSTLKSDDGFVTQSSAETTSNPTKIPTQSNGEKLEEYPQMKISMSYIEEKQKRKEPTDSSSKLVIAALKEKEEEWKHFSFRSVADDGIDCGDKQCYVEYRVLSNCYLILETNNTDCQIPCKMNGCDTELHHFIPCPIWSCNPFTTTTSSTTTTSTTERPQPRPVEPTMNPLIYTSIVLNIFFFGIVFAFLIVKFRTQITNRFGRGSNRRTENQNDETNPNRFFSIGNEDNEENERAPLITAEARLSTENISHGALESGNLSIVNTNANTNDSQNLFGANAPAIMHGIDNLALEISNENRPVGAIGNWEDVNIQQLTIESSQVSDGATAAVSLNTIDESKETKEKGSPVFFLMKNFRKK